MKIISLIILLINFVPVFAQQNGESIYFLNSREIDFEKTFINPENIDSIYVDKEVENGALHIFTKSKRFEFVTLKNILKKHTDIDTPAHSVLFRINEEYIFDTKGVRIDKSFFIYVKVTDVSQVLYLSDKYNELKIVEIDLEREERKPKFMIRGSREITKSGILNDFQD
ncbi:MAG: hypothetical protein ACQETJ_01540 [Bacteroidota bacterium]